MIPHLANAFTLKPGQSGGSAGRLANHQAFCLVWKVAPERSKDGN